MKDKEKQLIMNFIIALCMAVSTITGCKKPGTRPAPVPPPVVPADPYKDPEAYGARFTKVPDIADAVFYEVNLRSFSNEANFKGLENRLDNLKDLGINVIWIMPTYPVGILKSAGGLGSPYSVRDYTGVNTEFGNLDDLRKVVEEAHKRDMAVILDWVANHSAWDNPWIANKAWYQQDGAGNIISPLGTGWNDVAALNYNNTDMRLAMIRAMRYWIFTANIDGFRFDAADFVPTDFWKSALDNLKSISDRKLILLGEGVKKDQLTAGFQLNFAFEYYSTLKNVFAGAQAPSALFSSNTNEKNGLNPGTYKLRYSTNHDGTSADGSTITVYKGKEGAMAAFVLAITMDGVPLLYNGQEVGSPKKIDFFKKDPIDWTTNPDMLAEYKRIIAFRKTSNALKSGSLTPYNHVDMLAYQKKSGAEDVLVLVNPRNFAVTYDVPAAVQGAWKNALVPADVTLGAQVVLQPYQYMILKK